MSSVFEDLINQILEELLPELNRTIGDAIRNAGFDPMSKVVEDEVSIGIAGAFYEVTNLRGLSSIEFNSIVVRNVIPDGTSLSGELACDARFNSQLSARIEGGVWAPLIDRRSITGTVTFDGATISGNGSVEGSINSPELCLNNIDLASTNFNFSNGDIDIDCNCGPLDWIIDELAGLVFDATQSAIRDLISGEVKNVLNREINKILPQCIDS